MIKSRPFWFGLGSGLIAGALLLQLMISGGAAPLTKEQILQGAERLNLKVIDETLEPSSNEAESDLTIEAEEDKGVTGGSADVVAPSEPAVAASPLPVASPEAPVNTDKSNPPKEPSEPSEPSTSTTGTIEEPEVTVVSPVVTPEVQEVTQKSMVSVYIPNGSTLTETANLLADAGAIKDKNLFLKTANDREINTIIQYGTYSFDANENINSIIDKLITLKK